MATLSSFFKRTREWWYLGAALALAVALAWYAISSIVSLASVARSTLGGSGTPSPLPAAFDFATVDDVLGKPAP